MGCVVSMGSLEQRRWKMNKCWWCENEIDPDTTLNDGGSDDTVYQDGEPMHRRCRNDHLRTRELEAEDEKEV